MSLANTTYVIPLTTIYRQRMLPAPGRLLVRQGQKVAPKDVVAQATIAAEHELLDVARGLRVSPRKADQYIDRLEGEQVSEGDLIATGPQRLARRIMRAPSDGRIVYIKQGQILLQKSENPFELTAGYAGVVSELITDRGVEIEISGALIQGVWGNGQVEYGTMHVTTDDPGQIFKLDRVDVSLRGAILVGSHLEDGEALDAMADIPVRGLILGSMPAALIPIAKKVPYPILLTEGFGQIAMNIAAFRLFSTNTGREVSLNAETFDPYEGSRPEAIIPLPVAGKPGIPPLPRVYASNQRVRVVRAPYTSRVGVIQAILPGMYTFSNGVVASAAEVRLDNGEQVVVPLASLEVLEYK